MEDQNLFTLDLSRVTKGKHPPVTISICVTYIGTDGDVDYDGDLKIPSENKEIGCPEWALESDAAKHKGDRVWALPPAKESYVLRNGDAEDEEPDYFEVHIDSLVVKTFEKGQPMGSVTSGGNKVVLTTENWVD